MAAAAAAAEVTDKTPVTFKKLPSNINIAAVYQNNGDGIYQYVFGVDFLDDNNERVLKKGDVYGVSFSGKAPVNVNKCWVSIVDRKSGWTSYCEQPDVEFGEVDAGETISFYTALKLNQDVDEENIGNLELYFSFKPVTAPYGWDPIILTGVKIQVTNLNKIETYENPAPDEEFVKLAYVYENAVSKNIRIFSSDNARTLKAGDSYAVSFSAKVPEEVSGVWAAIVNPDPYAQYSDWLNTNLYIEANGTLEFTKIFTIYSEANFEDAVLRVSLWNDDGNIANPILTDVKVTVAGVNVVTKPASAPSSGEIVKLAGVSDRVVAEKNSDTQWAAKIKLFSDYNTRTLKAGDKYTVFISATIPEDVTGVWSCIVNPWPWAEYSSSYPVNDVTISGGETVSIAPTFTIKDEVDGVSFANAMLYLTFKAATVTEPIILEDVKIVAASENVPVEAAEPTKSYSFDFAKLASLEGESALSDFSAASGAGVYYIGGDAPTLEVGYDVKTTSTEEYKNIVTLSTEPLDFTGKKVVIDWEILDDPTWSWGTNNPNLSIKLITGQNPENNYKPIKKSEAKFALKSESKTAGKAVIPADDFSVNVYDSWWDNTDNKQPAEIDDINVIELTFNDCTGTVIIKSIKVVD